MYDQNEMQKESIKKIQTESKSWKCIIWIKKCRRSINKRLEQAEELDNFNTVYFKLSI